MASENALALLAQIDAGKALLPAAILIAGPQPFLKEYVLDACRDALRGPGREQQSFQINASGDFGAVLEAIAAPSLFAPATIATCRDPALARRRRRGRRRGGRNPLLARLRRFEIVPRDRAGHKPSHLILLYERDNAPAKVQRQVEKSGLAILCNKPFESQLPQFAALFARRLGLKINYATAETPDGAIRHESGRDAQRAGAGLDCGCAK